MAVYPQVSVWILIVTSVTLFWVALTDFREFKIPNEMVLALVTLCPLFARLGTAGDDALEHRLCAADAGGHDLRLLATADGRRRSSGGVSGSLQGGAAKLIIVQDISSSFANSCTYQGTACLKYAQTAIQDCAEYFKVTGSSTSLFGLSEMTGNSPQTGWKPNGWVTGNPTYAAPYYPLTAPTSSNWVTYPTINNTQDNEHHRHAVHDTGRL